MIFPTKYGQSDVRGGSAMYKQDFDPAGSLWQSGLIALLPLAVVLVLLGGFKWKAQWAALAGLGTALAVAIGAYGMPFRQALDAGAFGAAVSVPVILPITFNATWTHPMAGRTGHFEV